MKAESFADKIRYRLFNTIWYPNGTNQDFLMSPRSKNPLSGQKLFYVNFEDVSQTFPGKNGNQVAAASIFAEKFVDKGLFEKALNQ